MDTLLKIYKVKLKEALALVPNMSDEKKFEAVVHWNHLAEQFQTIIHKGEFSSTGSSVTSSYNCFSEQSSRTIFSSNPISVLSTAALLPITRHTHLLSDNLAPINSNMESSAIPISADQGLASQECLNLSLIQPHQTLPIMTDVTTPDRSVYLAADEPTSGSMNVPPTSSAKSLMSMHSGAGSGQPIAMSNISTMDDIYSLPLMKEDEQQIAVNLQEMNTAVNLSTGNLDVFAPIGSSTMSISGSSQHTCEVCKKTGFSTKGNLKRHLKSHSGEKPFKCEVCNSCFTEKKSLKIHVRRHTGEKPYKCEVCGKLFSQTGVLQSHMALHLNEKKFECAKCGKTFRQRSQLKLHQMRHDGIKRLECSTCYAKFLTKGDLERHYRIHTGERPYECGICFKTFTRQQSLNEHINRHTGKKPYDCKFCDKTFSEMSACYKHTKTHKKQEENKK